MKTIIIAVLMLMLSACGDNNFSSRNPFDSGPSCEDCGKFNPHEEWK